MRTRFSLCLALLAPLVLAQAPSVTPSKDGKPDKVPAEAWQIFVLANKARADAGVAPLQWDAALAAAARKHCVWMSLEGEISHRNSGEPILEQRAGEAGAHFSLIKENLAIGTDVAGIHEQWMGAADSRANLLDPDLDRAGVAVVALHGMLYVVTDYSQFVPALTQEQVEESIAGLLRARGISIAMDKQDARWLCAGRTTVSVSPSFVFIWQDTDMTKLPDTLEEVLPQAHFRKAAVGSCPAKDLDGNFNQYRMAALFYSTGVGVY